MKAGLRDIGSDAELQRLFESDREALMDRYELAEKEKEALRNRDLDEIKSLTGATDVRMTKSSIDVYS